jgi:hypothetical protein
MFERHSEPLLPRRAYLARVARSAAIAAGVIGGSLVLGVLGYHWFGGLAWIDALVNASMILGGMGPVDPIRAGAGKLFASAYALFSGFALLTSAGVLLAPIVHRFMHHFHLVDEDSADDR